MSDQWGRRRFTSGGEQSQSRYPEYNNAHRHSEQPQYHNPPPPYTHPPPTLYFSQPPPSYPTHHHYPDPQGVSPPGPGPVLDYLDYTCSRPGSILLQSNTPSNLYLPSMSTIPGNSYSKCSFCSLVFSATSLPTHLSSCHPHLLFQCTVPSSGGSVCGQQFLAVPQLRSHLFSHHLVTTFSCDKLARAGTIILPKDLRLYRCKKCPAEQGTFYGSGPHLMAVHLASHHPEVTGPASNSQLVGYECRACHLYPLEDESHLLKHIQLRHSRAREPSVELIPCPVPLNSPSPVYIAPSSPTLNDRVSADLPPGSPDPGGDTITSQHTELTRCNMCPSPGLVNKDQVETHLKAHNTALFTCAPCKTKFELYLDIEKHIKVEHNVSLASSIQESIILPTRKQLVTLQCGECARQFVGQVEQVLVSHIETTHGKYYVGVGGGKNIVRMCRLCGEVSRGGGEMIKHLDSEHGGKMFASDSDNDDTDTESEPVPALVPDKTKSTKVAFIDIFKEEVARRKIEYDRQQMEKKLRKDLCSDSSISNTSDVTESDSDVQEVDMEITDKKASKKLKKKKYEKFKYERNSVTKTKYHKRGLKTRKNTNEVRILKKHQSKSRKEHSSESEKHFSEECEDVRTFKRKFDFENEVKRKCSRKKKRVRVEVEETREKDKTFTKLVKCSKEFVCKDKSINHNGSEDTSNDSVQYKYQNYCKKNSTKDDKKCSKDYLIRKRHKNYKESQAVMDQVNDCVDIQLKKSSTEKLVEAKELVRVTIEKEENNHLVKQKNTVTDAKQLSDLVKLKQQLTETLMKSRELTKKMKMKHMSKNASRESDLEDNVGEIVNQDEGSYTTPVKTNKYKDNDSSDETNSHQTDQPNPTPGQKLSKFSMTWKKK